MCESASSLYLRTLKRNVICLILLNSAITMWRRMFWRIVLRPQLSVVIQRKKFRWSRSLLSVHFFWYACQISVKRAAYKVFNYIQTQCIDEIQPIIFSTWVVGCTEPCYLLGIHWHDATTRALSVEMMFDLLVSFRITASDEDKANVTALRRCGNAFFWLY